MKTILFLSLGLLLLAACKRSEKIARVDPWADYRKAYAQLTTNKDSAYYYFNQSASRSTDKQVIALAYYNMAMIQTDGGDYYGAQESLAQSLRSLDEHNPKDWNTLATDYNELGMTSTRLNNYRQAIHYYQLALGYDRDNTVKFYALNNRGNAYKKLKDYTSAIASYQQAIQISGKHNSNYARALTNLATAQWLQNPNHNPVPQLIVALAIRKQLKDTWGENSSYAQLSDYYLKTRPDSAGYYARQMLMVARRLQSPDDELEALQKLIALSPLDEIKPYFSRYQFLADSLESKRNAAKNQFALIRYNVEKSKADNLRLQKENTERNYQLGGLLFIVIAGAITTAIWYRKKRQRQQLEAESLVRENQLRLSQKVHDVIANGIYGVMSEVEYSETLDRDDLLDKLEFMYEQSRDISYESNEPNQNMAETLNRMLSAFKSKAIRLAVTGNEPGLWQPVSEEIKNQLQPILQELLVNLRKHSRASQAALSFERIHNTLMITYYDNGIGIPDNLNQGNGLRNTVSRIAALNGRLTFESQPDEKGTRLQIEIPLS